MAGVGNILGKRGKQAVKKAPSGRGAAGAGRVATYSAPGRAPVRPQPQRRPKPRPRPQKRPKVKAPPKKLLGFRLGPKALTELLEDVGKTTPSTKVTGLKRSKLDLATQPLEDAGKAVFKLHQEEQDKRSKGETFGADPKLKAIEKAGKELYKAHSPKEKFKRDVKGSETFEGIAGAVKNPRAAFEGAAKARSEREFKSQQAGAGDPLNLIRAPVETARAFVEKPKKTTISTGKSVPKILAGLIPGVVSAIQDPAKAGKEAVKEYERRYDPLVKGDTKTFRERVQEEGVIPEVLDTAAVGGIGGRAVGLAAKGTKFSQAPRPNLKVTPTVSKRQGKSPNALILAAQRGQDVVRKKATTRRERKVEESSHKTHRAVRPGKDEVVPVDIPGVPKSLQKRNRLIVRDVSDKKGRGLLSLRTEIAAEEGGARRNLRTLSRKEKKGFRHALEYGVRTPDQARTLAASRKAEIAEKRTSEVPRVRKKEGDEVKRLETLERHADEIFTPKLGQVVDTERRRSKRISQKDPGLDMETTLLRRVEPQARHLGMERQGAKEIEAAEAAVNEALAGISRAKDPVDAAKHLAAMERKRQEVMESTAVESPKAYANRVQRAAREQGLAAPGYFKHEPALKTRFSDRTLGSSAKAVAGEKKTRFKLLDEGKTVSTPETHFGSLARGVKRRFSWNFVADNADNYIIPGTEGKTFTQLQEHIAREGLDPNEVAVWNPEKFRQERTKHGEPDDFDDPAIGKAASDSLLSLKDMKTKPEDFKASKGFALVPKAFYDEVTRQGPNSLPARAWAKYAKGVPSKVILGTNPSWAVLQVLNNTYLAALAGVGPLTILKSQKFWRDNPGLKAELAPHIGEVPFGQELRGGKLGAAVPENWATDTWRAIKETKWLQRAGKANPLDVLFRFDQRQNAVFRRTILYNDLKRQAYQNIGQEVGNFSRAMEQLKGAVTTGPKGELKVQTKNKESLEQAAQSVDRILGNYTRYSTRERKYLYNNLMFYGFLRFSLRFTFGTLPRHHPVIASLQTTLAQMNEAEVRKLLGAKPGDELPAGALAKRYYTGYPKLLGKEIKSLPILGKMYKGTKDAPGEIPLARLNPAMNVFTQARDPAAVLGATSPLINIAANQLAKEDLYSGKDWKVRGGTETPEQLKKAGKPVKAGERVRIATSEALSLAAPYRILDKRKSKGLPQGQDSLLGDRPTRYKQYGILKSIAQSKGLKDRGGLARDLTGITPGRSIDREVTRQLNEGRRPKRKAWNKLTQAEQLAQYKKGVTKQMYEKAQKGSSGRAPGFDNIPEKLKIKLYQRGVSKQAYTKLDESQRARLLLEAEGLKYPY